MSSSNQKKKAKKAAPRGDHAMEAIQSQLEQEEERLLQYTLELSLRDHEVDNAEPIPSTTLIEEEKPIEDLFEHFLKESLLQFDPKVLELLNSHKEQYILEHDLKISSSYRQEISQLISKNFQFSEKVWKEKLGLCLLISSLLGNGSLIEYFIQRGADLSYHCQNQHWTSIHWAAAKCKVESLRLFASIIPRNLILAEFKDNSEITPFDLLAEELDQIPSPNSNENNNPPSRNSSSTSKEKVTDDTDEDNEDDRLNKSRYAMLELKGLDLVYELARAKARSVGNHYFDISKVGNNSNHDEAATGEAESQDIQNENSKTLPIHELFAWGQGDSNLLGHGDMSSRNFPKRVSILAGQDIISISTSSFNSAVVTADGKLFIWGLSNGMRLGYETSSRQEHLPTEVDPQLFKGQKIKSVSISNYHGAVLTEDGKVYTFGRGREGQLGRGPSNCDLTALKNQGLPSTVMNYANISQPSSNSNVTSSQQSSSSSNHDNIFGNSKPSSAGQQQHSMITCADFVPLVIPDSNEQIFARGFGKINITSNPIKITVHQIACSDTHTAFLTDGGKLWTFGSGSAGQLGHGTLQGEHSPRAVSAILPIRFYTLSVGPTHTAVASYQMVYILGFGTSTPRKMEFSFGPPRNAVLAGLFPSFLITQLASGTQHLLILTKAGDVFSWIHGVDKFPQSLTIDFKEYQKKQQQQKDEILAQVGPDFSILNPTNVRISQHQIMASDSTNKPIDREFHKITSIRAHGASNWLITQSGIVLHFKNHQRRSPNQFARLPILHRVKDFQSVQNHYLATICSPNLPSESSRPQMPTGKLFTSDIPQMLQTLHFSDVILENTFDSNERRAHRVILSIVPFFKEKFDLIDKQSSSPSSSPSTLPVKIQIDNCPIHILDLIIQWIYSGIIQLPDYYKAKSEDAKKLLSLSQSDKKILLDLCSTWNLSTLNDLIQAGRTAVNQYFQLPSQPNVNPHHEWVQSMNMHLRSHIANPIYSDLNILVTKDDHSSSDAPNRHFNTASQLNHQVSIPVHKCLVYSRSEWFRMALSSHWSESSSQEISFVQVRESTFLFFLTYIYCDYLDHQIHSSMKELADVIAASDELLMPDLKSVASRLLSFLIKPENASDTLQLAETFQCYALAEFTIKYMASNIELLVRLGLLSNLSQDQVQSIQKIIDHYKSHQYPYIHWKAEQEEKIRKMVSNLNREYNDLQATSNSLKASSGQINVSIKPSEIEESDDDKSNASTSQTTQQIAKENESTSAEISNSETGIPNHGAQSGATSSTATTPTTSKAYVPPSKRNNSHHDSQVSPSGLSQSQISNSNKLPSPNVQSNNSISNSPIAAVSTSLATSARLETMALASPPASNPVITAAVPVKNPVDFSSIMKEQQEEIHKSQEITKNPKLNLTWATPAPMTQQQPQQSKNPSSQSIRNSNGNQNPESNAAVSWPSLAEAKKNPEISKQTAAPSSPPTAIPATVTDNKARAQQNHQHRHQNQGKGKANNVHASNQNSKQLHRKQHQDHTPEKPSLNSSSSNNMKMSSSVPDYVPGVQYSSPVSIPSQTPTSSQASPSQDTVSQSPSKSFSQIQYEEMYQQTKRAKSFKEIQEEEKELEEHRVVEAYYEKVQESTRTQQQQQEQQPRISKQPNTNPGKRAKRNQAGNPKQHSRQ